MLTIPSRARGGTLTEPRHPLPLEGSPPWPEGPLSHGGAVFVQEQDRKLGCLTGRQAGRHVRPADHAGKLQFVDLAAVDREALQRPAAAAGLGVGEGHVVPPFGGVGGGHDFHLADIIPARRFAAGCR